MKFFKDKVPAMGYILPLWESKGDYRATALAYMERENVDEVENLNGVTYTKEQIKKAMLG